MRNLCFHENIMKKKIPKTIRNNYFVNLIILSIKKHHYDPQPLPMPKDFHDTDRKFNKFSKTFHFFEKLLDLIE